MSDSDVWVLGVSMTKFGKHPNSDIIDLASQAALGALGDAGVGIAEIGAIAAGNTRSANRSVAQLVQKQIGQTGIPAYNVANACATGATALRVALLTVRSGEADYALAVGVEKLAGAGVLAPPNQRSDSGTWQPEGRLGALGPTEGYIGVESMPGVFAEVGVEYCAEIGVRPAIEIFARIAEKNHAHSTLNPLAMYTAALPFEQIMNDQMIAYPNTRPMCSPNADGAAAAVIVSGRILRTLSSEQQRRAVKISASVLTTDPWTPGGQALPDINTLTRNAARQAYEQAGVGPEDLDLVELHDCFASAELVHYDNLMLCPPGGAIDFLESGAPWRDGSLPVNVSGGLLSKGHPISATGLANVYEVCTQLRGEAGDRQIEGARVGLTHVIGIGSACGVHILERHAAPAT